MFLTAEDGRRFLDFLSGYCVHNTGHNHPAIVSALQRELGREGPAMLQSHVSDLAGELAQRLCSLAGGRHLRHSCSVYDRCATPPMSTPASAATRGGLSA